MTPSAQSFDTESSLLPIVSGISHKRLLHAFKYTFGGQAVMPTPFFHTPSPRPLLSLLPAGGWARVASKTVPGSARRHTVALFPPQIAHTHVHPPTHPMHTRGSGRVVRVGLLRCLSIGQVVARPGRSLGHRRRCEQYTSPRNARASADFMGYST